MEIPHGLDAVARELAGARQAARERVIAPDQCGERLIGERIGSARATLSWRSKFASTRSSSPAGKRGRSSRSAISRAACGACSESTDRPTVVCSALAASARLPPMPATSRAMSSAERSAAPSRSISTVTSASQVASPSSMLPVRTTASTVVFGMRPHGTKVIASPLSSRMVSFAGSVKSRGVPGGGGVSAAPAPANSAAPRMAAARKAGFMAYPPRGPAPESGSCGSLAAASPRRPAGSAPV